MADRASHRPTRSADSGRNWREPLAFLSGRPLQTSASCPTHNARRDSACCSPLWGGSASRLRGQHLEHVTVRIAKVKAASAPTVIDLHIVKRAGAAALSDAPGPGPREEAGKGRTIDSQ